MHKIDIHTPVTELNTLLKKLGWLRAEETILSTSSPGAGNMNVVIRVHTQLRSFILKQSRKYVQKYQDIPAPLDRIRSEYAFYTAIGESMAGRYTPEIYYFDPSEHLLMMQDVGDRQDLTVLYQEKKIESIELMYISDALNTIHATPYVDNYPLNLSLRQLNYQHIFVLPFLKDNGFQLDDIQPGLQELSMSFKYDDLLKKKIHKLGRSYLSLGDTLLHGDYYPGSWLRTYDNVCIIDPEFTYIGHAEFDLGVMGAHLTLISGDADYIPLICQVHFKDINETLVQQIAGVEIMRRLIGLAQLPLHRSLDEKSRLLSLARQLIMD